MFDTIVRNWIKKNKKWIVIVLLFLAGAKAALAFSNNQTSLALCILLMVVVGYLWFKVYGLQKIIEKKGE